MHTFYYPNHTAHDPAVLHNTQEPHTIIYYGEVAQRAIIIKEALEAAEVGSLAQPGDFGLEPILDVHTHGLLNFLQTAYDRVRHETHFEVAIPETFNVRHHAQRKPISIYGLLGYYCFDTSAPIFEDTWDVAYWSAQTALSAAALVRAGGEQFAYALCRPPGHHASADMYGGFCYLNNAAIAAQWLVNEGQRVAILDIDYHHGNGTQSIFYHRADVLTCSIHANPLYEYPYYWGHADEFGQAAGINHNFNFPLAKGTGELAYLGALGDAFDKIRAFVPDTLIVSYGADTLENDPVGGFKLQISSYGRIGALIATLNLPTIIIQEGGYLLDSVGDCVAAFLKGIEDRA